MINSLYDDPMVHDVVFPVDALDARFFRSLIPEKEKGVVVDGGAGSCALIEKVANPDLYGVGLDLSPQMLRGKARAQPAVCADLFAMPFADRTVLGVISRLFGYAYAMAASEREDLLHETARVLMPGGALAIEVPMAWRPPRLCGVQESTQINEDLHYRFRYLDVLRESSWGSVLACEIEVTSPDNKYRLDAPLHVFTPYGAREWVEDAGLEFLHFYAPYDRRTSTSRPPADCLRAVVLARAPNLQ